ncbi:protein HGV2-like isoform X1 [Amphiura filiformis]|uniref:protein HGV2-like isoform X1 n=1 Tax=Amphiura filiformis TaxID=82378 RepID=UPI003B21193E
MSETAGPSSSTAESGEAGVDVIVEAAKLLGLGRRHLLVGDAPAAVQSLQEACGLLATQYGEMGDELGEAYFHYGSALLELGRMETGVLGNALDGVPDAATDDSDEEGGEERVESPDKVEDEGAGPSTGDDDKKTDDKAEGSEDKEEGDTAEEEEGDTAEEGTADEGEDAEKEGEGDDIPNFQLCWEILELARVIFSRKDDKEYKLKVSQVHLKLGELGLETEQYSQSIDDFTHCLNIQREHLDAESRLLAETQYNLGLACGFDKKFSDAIENFEGAKKVIENRIAKLEKSVKDNEGTGKGKEKADAEDPLVKDQKEIAELQDLLPEITAKLEDAKDMKKSAEDAASQAIAAAAAEFGLGPGASSSSTSAFGASSSSASTSEPAKPIQVRRKQRKPEEEASSESSKDVDSTETDAKRSKPDESGDAPKAAQNGHAATVNGHGAMNGHASMNGHDISPEKQEAKPKTVEKKINGDAAPAAAMETA